MRVRVKGQVKLCTSGIGSQGDSRTATRHLRTHYAQCMYECGGPLNPTTDAVALPGAHRRRGRAVPLPDPQHGGQNQVDRAQPDRGGHGLLLLRRRLRHRRDHEPRGPEGHHLLGAPEAIPVHLGGGGHPGRHHPAVRERAVPSEHRWVNKFNQRNTNLPPIAYKYTHFTTITYLCLLIYFT